MNLKELTGRSPDKAVGKDELPTDARCLTLLAEGAAAGVPEMGAEVYRNFRANIERLSRQLPDRLPDEDKLALIRSILHEFETYRDGAETALREQQAAWRAAASALLDELFASLGVDKASAGAVPLRQGVKKLATGTEISGWQQEVNLFLHPLDGKGPADELAARLRAADQSTENDNAAGLRGGGAAVEHLGRILGVSGDGFIVLFRLNCLDVVSQRFGPEAVEDCLMAVSAYLTSGLQSNDAIYHWSDSTLLAILQGRPNETLLTAELERVLAQNRESSINVAGRAIMLRIPLTFEIKPISQFRTAEDLLRVAAHAGPRNLSKNLQS